MSSKRYDHVSLYNPEGKVEPFTHVKAASQLGSLSISIATQKHGILLCHLVKQKLELPKKKIFKINKNAIYTFSGITNDGVDIFNYLQNHCVFEKVNKGRQFSSKVFDDLSAYAAFMMMVNSGRPIGCEALFLNKKPDGSIENCCFLVGGDVKHCFSYAIGNRSQSALTILERDYRSDMEFDDMVRLGLKALRNAISDLKSEDVEVLGLNMDGAFEVNIDDYF